MSSQTISSIEGVWATGQMRSTASDIRWENSAYWVWEPWTRMMSGMRRLASPTLVRVLTPRALAS